MESSARSRSARYVFIGILAVLVALVGFTGDRFLPITVEEDPVNTATTPSPGESSEPTAKSTKDPLASDPAPPLLDAGSLSVVKKVIDTQRKAGDVLIQRWFTDNGTGTADEGFVSWAAAQLPPEPDTFARQSEQTTRKGIKSSPAGDKAAAWLNKHGCADVWNSFTTQQLELRSTTDDEPSAKEMKTVLDLAAKVASAAQDRSGSPAASQPEPCSATKDPARSDCACSYPSAQATMSAAARTYLGEISPYRYDTYRWMESQVALASVYAGLELPSDIGSGTLLGQMVGRYVLVTRGHSQP
jgi:hypothetical protein